jgi:hypothetical protein
MRTLACMVLACCMVGCIAEDPFEPGELVADEITTENSEFGVILLAATSEAVVYTGGTAAAKAWFNSGVGKNYWDLKDDKCDGKSPILFYRIDGGDWSYKLTTGCGTVKRIYLTQGQVGDTVRYYLGLTTSYAESERILDIKR